MPSRVLVINIREKGRGLTSNLEATLGSMVASADARLQAPVRLGPGAAPGVPAGAKLANAFGS